jgi:hypothetical protein
MGPIDSPFGSRRVRTNPINIQFIECPTKLRVPIAAGGILLVDPKNAGYVALERHCLAVAIDIVRCVSRGWFDLAYQSESK